MKTIFQRWKVVLHLAWPLVIANSFWNLQITIDRVFLGNFSTEALGASMAASGLYWAPMALLQQTAAYITTFIAQYFGAKEFHNIGPALWQSFYVSLIGGVLFLVLVPFTPWLISVMGHSEKLQILEIEYFSTLCFAALPMALVAGASGFFTGLGRTSIIIIINGIGLIFNVAFDYLFIFGKFGFPEMGIAGAGVATALSSCAAAACGLFLIFNSSNENLYKVSSAWRLNKKILLRFLKFGIPSGLQWALEGLAFTAFLIYIGRLPNGEAALASSSVTVTIMLMAVLPALGVGQAVSVLVGQYLGEGLPKSAERVSWDGCQIATTYILIMGLTFVAFPSFYLSWFANKENIVLWEQVETIVPYLLMFVALFTLFDSLNLVLSFALKGAGDTKFVSMVALILPWPFMVIPTIVVSDWDTGVYWAWGFASLFIIVQALVFLWRFVGGRWKSMSVIH